MKNKRTVLIMGAGVAGLAAALKLVEAGYKVTVVEKEKQVGGLATTLQKGKFRFDTGPHRWYAKNDEINNWMLNFMKGELIKVPRLSRIYFDGKYISWPLKVESLFVFPIWKAFLAGFDYFLVYLKNLIIKPRRLTLEDGFINKFGRTMYGLFFKRYTEKLWGRKCHQMSYDWIDQRTRGFNVATILREVFFKKTGVVSFIDEFYYPRLGIGRIAERMAEKIKKHGGKIILNANVKKLNVSQNRINETEVEAAGEKQVIAADEFVSSIPLPYLVKIISPEVPLVIIRTAKKLQFRAEVQVVVFVKKTRLTNDTWIYVHNEEIPYVRMMEMDNWSVDMSPSGSTTLVFEIPCELGDRTWRMTDDLLAKKIIKIYKEEFKLITENDVLGWHVHRLANLLPVYHLGYKDDLMVIKRYLKKYRNLQIIGRNGIFRYNNSDHSIEMGFYAAANIIGGNEEAYDIESIAIEREFVEEKRLSPGGE